MVKKETKMGTKKRPFPGCQSGVTLYPRGGGLKASVGPKRTVRGRCYPL